VSDHRHALRRSVWQMPESRPARSSPCKTIRRRVAWPGGTTALPARDSTDYIGRALRRSQSEARHIRTVWPVVAGQRRVADAINSYRVNENSRFGPWGAEPADSHLVLRAFAASG